MMSRSGVQLGKFERGRRYICNRKDEIMHGLSQSVKCVAPLLETRPWTKYEMQQGRATTGAPTPPTCAPGLDYVEGVLTDR